MESLWRQAISGPFGRWCIWGSKEKSWWDASCGSIFGAFRIRHCCMENNGFCSDSAFICISAAAKPFRRPGWQSVPGHGWGSIPTVASPSAQAAFG